MARAAEGTAASGQLYEGRQVTLSRAAFTILNRDTRIVTCIVGLQNDGDNWSHIVHVRLFDLRIDAPVRKNGWGPQHGAPMWTVERPQRLTVRHEFQLIHSHLVLMYTFFEHAITIVHIIVWYKAGRATAD